jgi:hypothetical protein
MRHSRQPVLMLAFGVLLGIGACAIITVNVYFPEKDVKSAYRSLEDELLQPAPKKEDRPTVPSKPLSRLEQVRSLVGSARHVRITLVPDAFAQDDLSKRITEEIKNYPEVVAAYRSMGQRLERLDQLRDQGLVGEGKDGMAVLRARPPQVSDADVKLVGDENKDRVVVINGMAKAILKLTKQEATSANLASVKTQASETFASLRRDRARAGWSIQLPDGTWRQK